eukprot:8541601-Alexandrium_andersonii.AAC.1
MRWRTWRPGSCRSSVTMATPTLYTRMLLPPPVLIQPRWPCTGRISPPPLPRPLNATPWPR